MDGTQVGILKKTNKVGLGRLLKGEDCRGLEAKVGLEVLSNLTDKTLKGSLADEQLGRFLVFTNLTEGDGSGTITVGLLNTSGSGSGLAGGLKRWMQ
jgi:hypothetical protein